MSSPTPNICTRCDDGSGLPGTTSMDYNREQETVLEQNFGSYYIDSTPPSTSGCTDTAPLHQYLDIRNTWCSKNNKEQNRDTALPNQCAICVLGTCTSVNIYKQNNPSGTLIYGNVINNNNPIDMSDFRLLLINRKIYKSVKKISLKKGWWGKNLYQRLKLDQLNPPPYGDGWNIREGNVGYIFMSSFLHHMIFKEVIKRFDIPLPPFTPVLIRPDVGHTPPVQNPPPPPNCLDNKISDDSPPCFTDPISLECLQSNRYSDELVFMDCPRQIIYTGIIPGQDLLCVNFTPYQKYNFWYLTGIGSGSESPIEKHLRNNYIVIIRSSILNNSSGNLIPGSVVEVLYNEKWIKGILIQINHDKTFDVNLDIPGYPYFNDITRDNIRGWKGPRNFPFLLIFKPDKYNHSCSITNIWLNPVDERVLIGGDQTGKIM